MKKRFLVLMLTPLLLLGCSGGDGGGSQGDDKHDQKLVDELATIYNNTLPFIPSYSFYDESEERSAFFDFFDNNDITIVGKRCGRVNTDPDTGLAFQNYYYVFKYSRVNNYYYYSINNFDEDSSSYEQVVCFDGEGHPIEYIYRHFDNTSDAALLESANGQQYEYFVENFYELYVNSLEFANPNVPKQYKAMRDKTIEEVGPDASIRELDDSEITDQFQEHLFYSLAYPQSVGQVTYPLYVVENPVPKTIVHPLTVKSWSIEKDNDVIDLKYDIDNFDKNTMLGAVVSGGRYSNDTYNLMSAKYHFTFSNGKPTSYTKYLYNVSDEMKELNYKDGYYEALNIDYSPLPTNPRDLFDGDYSVNEESELLKNQGEKQHYKEENVYFPKESGFIDKPDSLPNNEEITDLDPSFTPRAKVEKHSLYNALTVSYSSYVYNYLSTDGNVTFTSKYDSLVDEPEDLKIKTLSYRSSLVFLPKEIVYESSGKTIPIHAIGKDVTYSIPNNVSDIYIPKEITEITRKFSFVYGGNITIFCEADSKPEGWIEDWTNCPNIVWGYDATDYQEFFKCYVSNSASYSRKESVTNYTLSGYVRLRIDGQDKYLNIESNSNSFSLTYQGTLTEIELYSITYLANRTEVLGRYHLLINTFNETTIDDFNFGCDSNGMYYESSFQYVSKFDIRMILQMSIQGVTIELNSGEILHSDKVFSVRGSMFAEKVRVEFDFAKNLTNVKSITIDKLYVRAQRMMTAYLENVVLEA